MSALRQTVVHRRQVAEPLARHADRTVVGTPVEIANFVMAAQASGRLVYASAPQAMPGGDLRLFVHVRVRERPIPAPSQRHRHRPEVIGAALVALIVTLSGIGYLLYLLVQAVIAALPMLCGGLAILGALWLLLGRAGVCCPGLHCPGCRH